MKRTLQRGILGLGILGMMLSGVYAGEKAASSEYKLDGKKIELARYAKAYIGQGNVTVEIAPFTWEYNGRDGAILLFKGIESPWDGQAIHHRVRRGAYNGTEYVTDYEGKEWTTLIMGRDGTNRIVLYVPDVKEEIKLAPSDGAAQLTSPQAIFQEYQKQHAKKEGAKP